MNYRNLELSPVRRDIISNLIAKFRNVGEMEKDSTVLVSP